MCLQNARTHTPWKKALDGTQKAIKGNGYAGLKKNPWTRTLHLSARLKGLAHPKIK